MTSFLQEMCVKKSKMINAPGILLLMRDYFCVS
jgi:hypothetical protein